MRTDLKAHDMLPFLLKRGQEQAEAQGRREGKWNRACKAIFEHRDHNRVLSRDELLEFCLTLTTFNRRDLVSKSDEKLLRECYFALNLTGE